MKSIKRIAYSLTKRNLFDVKINGITVFKVHNRHEAEECCNMIASNMLRSYIRRQWLEASRGGYKGTAERHAQSLCKVEYAMQGVEWFKYKTLKSSIFFTTR